MKRPNRRHLLPIACLISALLATGCTEQEGQINSLKDSISRLRESNNTGTQELQKMTQRLSTLSQEVRNQQSKRNEFEAKAGKSESTERLIVKYRTELEESLNNFTTAVSDYRKQNLP